MVERQENDRSVIGNLNVTVGIRLKGWFSKRYRQVFSIIEQTRRCHQLQRDRQ